MMSRAVGGFLETLRTVVSLTQESLPSREDVVCVAAQKFEFDAKTLQDVNALRDRDTSLPTEDAEELYDKFMALVDKVAQVTDQME